MYNRTADRAAENLHGYLAAHFPIPKQTIDNYQQHHLAVVSDRRESRLAVKQNRNLTKTPPDTAADCLALLRKFGDRSAMGSPCIFVAASVVRQDWSPNC